MDVSLIGNHQHDRKKCQSCINVYKDIGLAVNMRNTKYMNEYRIYNRGTLANEHVFLGSNSYEKVKNL